MMMLVSPVFTSPEGKSSPLNNSSLWVMFFSGSFQDFLLCLQFQHFECDLSFFVDFKRFLSGIHWVTSICRFIAFVKLGKFFALYFFNIFSLSFSSSSAFWSQMTWILEGFYSVTGFWVSAYFSSITFSLCYFY
jgi:hypothetical protein